MKKQRLVKTVLGLTTVCAVSLMCGNIAHAQDVPVYLYNTPTVLDVTLPESINMKVNANEVVAAVDVINVKNNSLVGIIGVEKIHAEKQNGYTIVADTTDFTKLPMDNKKISLTYNTHDLISDYNQLAVTVDPTSIKTIQLSGKSGGVTTAINGENCANIVLTIAYQ